MSGSRRAKIRVVTAYVEIPNHPRSPVEYGKLSKQLVSALGDFQPMVFAKDTIRNLWMTPFIERQVRKGHHIRAAQGDNPAKNSMEYHAVQHNKFEWLERALMADPEADTFVWIDIGAMALPGFDGGTLTEFLRRIRKGDLAMPGCWEKKEVTDTYPCWRFCGTLAIIPRQDVLMFNKVFKAITRLYVLAFKTVSWEVNDLARMELEKVGPPIRWYPADHNALMLTRYE